MNWFTNGVIAGHTAAQKQELFDEDGGCEHVEADINLAVAVRREMDSFGPVSSHVVCEACDKKADEEDDEEAYFCCDCKRTFKAKDGIHWRWYDFYAAQGDVPLHICNGCRQLPKHLARIAKDQSDYDAEFGNGNYDD